MIQIKYEADANRILFDELLSRWGIVHNDRAPLVLAIKKDCITLQKARDRLFGEVKIDFITGTLAYRRRFGGGRGEAIAKAVGIKNEYLPHVLDATAGLGRDAFILASLGCKVTLFERHPVVGALLEDGLRRAYADPETGKYLHNHMQLVAASGFDAISVMKKKPDVVYLDPMFPQRQKRALVKKEMQLFQLLVGTDNDANALLDVALALAKKRVVVKRPSYADFLTIRCPDLTKTMKNHRFDIYLTP